MARTDEKRIMFWGDIIHNYPELIPRIPRDVTVLDWGYWHNHNVDGIRVTLKRYDHALRGLR